MKRKKNLYDKIVDLKKIQEIYQKRIRINTKNKAKLEVFEDHYTSNITYIKLLLEQRKYVPRRYHIFLVKEPKIRLIMSQDIIDKIINHMVSKYILVDIFDKVLINENIATREGRGTHYGIHLLKKYLNEIKEYDQFYILKFDIKKYFYNLDHEIIKKQISKKIKDKEALKILYDIIDSTDEPYINQNIETLKKRELLKLEKKQFIENKEYLKKQIEEIPYYRKGKGLPIGNMSSQVLAILYLNELDHFIKEKLKIKYYIRYMDDGIILNENKEYLEYCLKKSFININ